MKYIRQIGFVLFVFVLAFSMQGKKANAQETTYKKGIDVSHHQGAIDWGKVKAAGIDFAIIRCGYGDDMESQDDRCWEANIKGCEENGIPYGIYIYSYATTPEMVDSEVRHTLRLIKETGAKPTYPSCRR